MEFTFSAYKNMITTSLINGYEICSYENVTKFNKSIILRHDIDFSPIKAIDIAKIEQKLGVKSTYFVLVSTEFYNIFSRQTAEIFNQILEMGHDIGLHFDEQRYNSNSVEEMKEHVYYESKVLEKALGITLKVVSMHRPSKFTLENNIEFIDLINSYNKVFFKEIKYVSDSRMHWREDVMEVIKSNKYDKLHILTHPFWYSNKNETIETKLLDFINVSRLNTFKNLKDNFRDLEEYINENFLNGVDFNAR